MSILIHKDTKVIVQGITGRAARFHTEQMQAYGTNVVGGTAPGKAGQVCCGVPVFNTVRDAVAVTGANASVISCRLPLRPTPSWKRWKQDWNWWYALQSIFRWKTW